MASLAEIDKTPFHGSERAVNEAQILTEAEINDLLTEAETRLREAQKSKAIQKNESFSPQAR